MLIIKLPFPPADLMPNRKNGKHWGSTVKVKDDQKQTAYLLTKQAMKATGPQEWPDRIALSLLYVSPDKRHRDADNLLAASKSAIDGIAQALGVDDKRFSPILIDKVLGSAGGALVAAVDVQIVTSMAFVDA